MMGADMLDNSEAFADQYHRDGYIFPIRAFSAEQAAAYRARLEEAEAKVADHPDPGAFFREYANIGLDFVGEIVKDPAVTDYVAAILGEDLLILGCSFFIKEPNTPAYVSWHQDLHYWGLEADDEITAWVALSDVTRASGCMRFVPGSHREIVAHQDTYHEDNLLTRGQEIAVEVDDGEAVDVELRPGEMSIHHGRLFHASDPNTTGDRRIGLAIRYIPTRMTQIGGADMCVTLVRGEDRYGNFTLADSGTGLLTAEDIARHADIRERRRKVLYRETA
ncbi:MAG: phytanoyl-CoA dioxygenase family protein [Pseudomonadota bacterium]